METLTRHEAFVTAVATAVEEAMWGAQGNFPRSLRCRAAAWFHTGPRPRPGDDGGRDHLLRRGCDGMRGRPDRGGGIGTAVRGHRVAWAP